MESRIKYFVLSFEYFISKNEMSDGKSWVSDDVVAIPKMFTDDGEKCIWAIIP